MSTTTKKETRKRKRNRNKARKKAQAKLLFSEEKKDKNKIAKSTLYEEWNTQPKITKHDHIVKFLTQEVYGDIFTSCDHAESLATEKSRKEIITQKRTRLTYGEITPQGIDNALLHILQVDRAKILFDVGGGIFKLAFYIFLNYLQLDHVLSCEILPARYRAGKQFILENIKRFPNTFQSVTYSSTIDGEQMTIQDIKNRKFTIILGSFENHSKAMSSCDIILMNVDFGDFAHEYVPFWSKNIKQGCRLLSYTSLSHLTHSIEEKDKNKDKQKIKKIYLFKQVKDSNVRVDTTWASSGYPFNYYVREDNCQD